MKESAKSDGEARRTSVENLTKMATQVVECARRLDPEDPEGKEVSRPELLAAVQCLRQAVAEHLQSLPSNNANGLENLYTALRERGAAREAPPIPYSQAEILLQQLASHGVPEEIPAQVPQDVDVKIAQIADGPLRCQEPQELLRRADPSTLGVFLERYGLQSPTQSDATALLHAFIYDFLWRRQCDAVDLESRQREGLRESLRYHGVNVEESDPYEILRVLSAKNTARLSAQYPYQFGTPGMEEAERLVSGIEVTFGHNSRVVFHEKTQLPLISSRELQLLGAGGLNTHPFNSSFLHSDQNVFWCQGLQFKARPDWITTSVYGRHGCVLDGDYAKSKLWVSAFVMYPCDLFFVAERQMPSLCEDLVKELERAFPEDDPKWSAFWRDSKGNGHSTQDLLSSVRNHDEFIAFVKSSPAMAKIRDRLGEFDFTAEDFENLARTQLLFELNLIREKEPERFSRWMDGLQRVECMRGYDYFLSDLWGRVLRRLGFRDGLGFEGKVPVAVPAEAIARCF